MSSLLLGTATGRFIQPLTVALLLLTGAIASHAQTPLLGREAPDFVLRTLAQDNLRLSEYRGQVVLINFWASWCGPCRQQMPALDEMYAKYQRAGLVLLSVNVDGNAEVAAETARALKLSHPVLVDADQQVGRLYQIGTTPTSVLVDREGIVRHVFESYKPGFEKRYAQQLRELINE